MPVTRPIDQIENDVENWIQQSTSTFEHNYKDAGGRVWVLKFFPPRYLRDFFNCGQRLHISVTPGYTWGDGVYVVPLRFHYSTMMFGRIGVMGWIHSRDAQRIYDASLRRGKELYQEWIAHFAFRYDLLTTTIHAATANRDLRNNFRENFNIDLVVFKPDQENTAYVDRVRDRWFLLSDWLHRAVPSNKVRECEWVAIVEEEFEEETLEHYKHLFGEHLVRIPLNPLNRPNLTNELTNAWRNQLTRPPGQPPNCIYRVRADI